ncbi:MAG: hypothetical protein ACRDQF_02245 [Thermocrispum sp.]
MIVRVLLSRRVPALVGALAVLAVLGALLARNTIVIDLRRDGNDARLPFTELCAIVGATVAALAMRPRFWEWDRVGTARASVVSATCAAAGIVLPSLIVLSAGVVVPGELVLGSLVNAGFLCGLIFLLTPLLGSLAAGSLGIVMWFGVGVLNNVEPASVAYTPILAYSQQMPASWPGDRWYYALTVGVLAVAVHAHTRGSTPFAQRTFVRDAQPIP